ncbi:hypothetical protein DXG03_009466 [Asterophora parasitica]|uniref:Chromatin modification-related protein n=1 Tax=Asterophora parasitica TaxID=117018 RepID=A0A9P7G6V8_9AGAR|nr:hypothetical protein DXG03_009466 [Asterophora parasitica]
MPSRKRKRADLSPGSDGRAQSPASPDLDAPQANEQNVWEAVREEHFEAIEQLPLTLHRQNTLIHELDQQVNAHNSTSLATILKYIQKRRAISRISGEAVGNPSTTPGQEVELQEEQPRFPQPITFPSTTALNAPAATRIQTNGLSAMPQPPTTTRQILPYIASLREEILRASEEKVNVAQAAHDSTGLSEVVRHVSMLKQAIKEQEASIALGARPGHLEPSNLFDLAVGRWVKPSRATLSPINSDDFEGDNRPREQVAVDVIALAEEIGRIHIPPRGGRKGRGKPKGQEDPRPQFPPLTITLPAQPVVTASGAAAAEETYCYCQQGSFGEMIACDNKKCPREWYHIGCVGLQDIAPEGLKTWYCPDCRPARSRGGPKRK